MNNDHYIDEYAEGWINFMYCYEAQKQNPAIRSIFYERIDPVIHDLLKKYEAGSIDLSTLRDQMIAYARSQPPVTWPDDEEEGDEDS